MLVSGTRDSTTANNLDCFINCLEFFRTYTPITEGAVLGSPFCYQTEWLVVLYTKSCHTRDRTRVVTVRLAEKDYTRGVCGHGILARRERSLGRSYRLYHRRKFTELSRVIIRGMSGTENLFHKGIGHPRKNIVSVSNRKVS